MLWEQLSHRIHGHFSAMAVRMAAPVGAARGFREGHFLDLELAGVVRGIYGDGKLT